MWRTDQGHVLRHCYPGPFSDASYKIGHARINGIVRVLCKTRLIFPPINGPNELWTVHGPRHYVS